MVIDLDTIREAAATLDDTDRLLLLLAQFAPLVTFARLPLQPLARLVGENGLANELGRAVAAWCVLTGEGFTERAIEAAKVRLVGYGIDDDAWQEGR